VAVPAVHPHCRNSAVSGQNPLAFSWPLLPPQPPPLRRLQEWRSAGCFRSTAPTWAGDPKSQARSSLAQREPARSTGGDRPSGTDMERVAAARTTGYYRNPYQAPRTEQTGGSCSTTHTGIGANGGSHWRLDRAAHDLIEGRLAKNRTAITPGSEVIANSQ
jgi:hypothetical protein